MAEDRIRHAAVFVFPTTGGPYGDYKSQKAAITAAVEESGGTKLKVDPAPGSYQVVAYDGGPDIARVAAAKIGVELVHLQKVSDWETGTWATVSGGGGGKLVRYMAAAAGAGIGMALVAVSR